jgi:hypothetical protein
MIAQNTVHVYLVLTNELLDLSELEKYRVLFYDKNDVEMLVK